MGLKAYKQHTAISINDICDEPAKTQGDDIRIVEICTKCPIIPCIETTSKMCPRFKEMRAKVLSSKAKKHNRIKKPNRNNKKVVDKHDY